MTTYRFPGDAGYRPAGHPDHVPSCAFRADHDKKDWRCNCRAKFDSLDELAAHVKAYNDAQRDWEDRVRNEAHEKWMANR